MKWDGFDYWAISLTLTEIEKIKMGLNADLSMKQKRCGILYQIIANMINNGAIAEPAELRDGIDFETNLRAKKWAADLVDHRWNRGFPNSVLESFGAGTRTGEAELTSDYAGANSSISTYQGEDNHEYFLVYIRNAMWFTEAEFTAKYAQFPVIMEKYNMVVRYLLDNYGMDLEKMAAGPQQ